MSRTAASLCLIASLAAMPAAAKAPGLTVKTGESWLFTIRQGQPANPSKAGPSANPGPGQILVTVRAMMGTTMTITSNNPVAYTYKAELVGAAKAAPIRSCTLPANNRLSFENWPQKATAIRLSDFKPAAKSGSCP